MDKIDILYHGTSDGVARVLAENGWKPGDSQSGGNCGQSRFLYVSTGYEDALWFAEEKGCDAVVELRDVPVASLVVDPEDGVYDTVAEELAMGERSGGMPVTFALKSPLDAEHFRVIEPEPEKPGPG